MKDLIRRRKPHGLLFGAALLFTSSLFITPATAQGQPDAVASSPSVAPPDISPDNADGAYDSSTLQAHFSIRPPGAPKGGPPGRPIPQTVRNEIRVTYDVKTAGGTVVRTLSTVAVVPALPAGSPAGARVELDVAVAFDGKDTVGTFLADASYSVEIKGDLYTVTPQSSRLVATTNTVTTAVRIDNTPPSITNLSPPDGTFSRDALQVIGASYSDSSVGMNLTGGRISVNGVDVTPAASFGPVGVSFTPTSALPEGSIPLSLSIGDNVGNVSSVSWGFTEDRTAPTVTLSPADGSAISTNTPLLRAAYFDPAPGAGVDTLTLVISIDGQNRTAEFTITSSETSFQIQGGTPLGEGSHTLDVTLDDALGNSRQVSSAFVVDTVPPSIAGLTPADGTFTRDGRQFISATYGDATTGADPASAHLSVNGVEVTAEATVGPDGIAFRPAGSLPEGPIPVTLRIADRVGNVATATWTFTEDYTPPALSTFPVANQFVPTATPQITLSYTDLFSGVDTTTLRLSVDGVDVTATTAIEPDRARFTVRPSAPVFDGDHTLSAQVADRVGNMKQVDVAFRVDTSFPTLRISPAGGERVGTGTPTIILSYADTGSGLNLNSLRMELDGLDISGIASRSSSAAAFGVSQDSPLAEGEHTFVASIADHAGNVTPISAVFFVSIPASVLIPPGAPLEAHSIRAGEPSLLTLNVIDASGHGVPGILVNYQILTGNATLVAANGGSVRGSSASAPLAVITDSRGSATVTLTADTTSPVQIATSFPRNPGLSGPQYSISVLPASLAKLVLSGIPEVVQVGAVYSPTILALDSHGNPNTGFSGMLRVESSAIDADGDGFSDSRLVYFPPSSTGSLTLDGLVLLTRSGASTVVVKTVDEPVVFATTAVQVLPGPPSTLERSSGDQQVLSGGTSAGPVSVRATDRFGNSPLPVTVRFEPIAGPAAFTSGDPKSALATTTAEGVATSPPLAQSEVGLSIIRASVPGFDEIAPVTFALARPKHTDLERPAVVFESPTDYQVINGTTVTISVLVTDGSLSGGISPLGVEILLDSVSINERLTPPTGVGSESRFAGTLSEVGEGPHVLEVLVADLNFNETRSLIEFTVAKSTAGPVATLVKVSGDGQSGNTGSLLPEPFVVRATDGLGQPSPGQQIRFAVKTEAPLDYQQVGNLSLARSHSAGVFAVLSGTVNSPTYLVIDGLNGGEASYAIDAIDLNKGTAKNIGRTVVPRYDHAAVLIADGTGRVLITGGVNAVSGADERTAEVFDATKGTSTVVGQMLEARRGQQMLVLDADHVLIIGGSDTATTEVFQVSTGTFSYGPPLSTARRYFTVNGFTALVDVGGGLLQREKRLLVAGGSQDGSAESFDYETRTFSPAGRMTRVRSRHAAATIPMIPGWTTDRVLVTGGSNSKIEDTAEIYDPAMGTFTNIGPMADGPRAQHVAVSGAAGSGSVGLVGGISSVGADGTPVVKTSIEVYNAAQGAFTIGAQMPTGRYAFNVVDYYQTPTSRVFYIVGGRTGSASGGTTALSSIDRLTPPMSIPAGTFNDLSQVYTTVTNDMGEATSLPYIVSMTTGTNQIDVTSPGSQAAVVAFTVQSVLQPPPPPGTAATFTTRLEPTIVGIGEQTQLTVTAVDSAGNVIKNYSGKARIQEEAASAGAVKWDAMERTFAADGGGQVTFTGTAQSAPSMDGRYRFRVLDPSNTATRTGSGEVLVHGSAVTIQIKVPNTNPKVGDQLQISLYYADAHGLSVNNFAGSATLSTNPPSVTTLDGVSVPVSKGSGTASGTIASYPIGGMLGITATDSQDPMLTGTTYLQVQQVSTGGILASLRLDIIPSTATIGETVMLTVGAYDASGMLIPNYAGSISVRTSEPGVVPEFDTFALAFQGTEGGQKSITGVVAKASTVGWISIKAETATPPTIAGDVVLTVPMAVTAPSMLTSFGTGDSGTIPISQGFSIVSGNDQSAPAGSTLPERFVVALRDVNGNGIPGQDVIFTVMSAEGRFENDGVQAIVQTDAMGLAASPFFVLSTTPNLDYLIQAAASTTLPLLDFKVHTSAQPGTPDNLKISADLSLAPPGAVATLTGSVMDKAGVGVPDQAVTFSIISGNGQFEGGATQLSATTQVTGRTPGVSFTLSVAEGVEAVIEMTLPGSSLIPARLTLRTTARHLTLLAPSLVRSGEVFDLRIEARDAYDGADLSVDDDIALSDDPRDSTSFNGAVVHMTAGVGSVTGSATYVPNRSKTTIFASRVAEPSVYGSLSVQVVGPPSSTSAASGNSQVGPSGSVLPSPLAAVVYDANKNPVSGVNVAFSPVEQPLSLTPVAGTPLAVGRSNAAVVDLGGGNTLLIGGVDGQMIYGVDRVNAAGSYEALKLIEPRLNPQATRLPDNSILVTGGTDPATGTARDSAELIDNRYSTSVLLPRMNRARTGHVAIIVEREAQQNKPASVLITGGSGDASIEFYDPATKTFTLSTLEDIAVRAFGTATRITANGNPAVLLAGGTSAVSQGALYFFKPAESIAATGGMMRPRINATATLLADGNVLFACGQNGVIEGSTEKYIASMGMFAEASGLLTPRTHHRAIPIADGKVLLVGGFSSVDPVTGPVANTTAEVFDVVSGEIDQFDMPPELQVWDAAAVPVDTNRVFVMGGRKRGASGPEASAATWTLTYATASHAGVFVGHEAESEVTVPTTAAGLAFSPLFRLSSTPGENRVRVRLPDFPGVSESTFVLTGTEVVQPAAIRLAPFPTQLQVGDQLTLEVAILGSDGMVLTNATGDVTLSTNSPGCTTFDGMLLHFAGTEGGVQTISSSVSFLPPAGILMVNAQLLSPSLSGNTTVLVTAPPTPQVTHLSLTASPMTLVGRAGFTLTVRALNDAGMTEGLLDAVHFASNPPGYLTLDGTNFPLPPTGIGSPQGAAAVDVTAPMTVLLTASVPTRPEIQSATVVFTLLPASSQVASLGLALNPLPPFTLGQTFTLTIIPKDANGNPISPFNGTGRVSDTAGATSLVNYPFTFSQNTPPGGLTIPGTVLAAPASGTSEFVVTLDSPVIPESRLSFSVLQGTDTKPPSISLSPTDGETVTTAQPVISAFVTDESGVDTKSFAARLDATDVTGQFVLAGTIPPPGGTAPLEFRWDLRKTGSNLATGPHTLLISIADARGNPASATSKFSVDTSTVPAPTTVILAPDTPPTLTTHTGDTAPTRLRAILLDQNQVPMPNYPTRVIVTSGLGRISTLDGTQMVSSAPPSPALQMITDSQGMFGTYFYPSQIPGEVHVRFEANPWTGVVIQNAAGPATAFKFVMDPPPPPHVFPALPTHLVGYWAPDRVLLEAVSSGGYIVRNYTGTVRLDFTGNVAPNGFTFPTPRFVAINSWNRGMLRIETVTAFAREGFQHVTATDVSHPDITGTQEVRILPGHLSGNFTFPQPAVLHLVAGNHQVADALSMVPFPFQARLTDVYGNPVPSTVVVYTRILGSGVFPQNGSLPSASVLTSGAGLATSFSYLTGASYGTEIVRAAVPSAPWVLPLDFVVHVQDATPPDPPTALQVTPGFDSASLVWNPSVDHTTNGPVTVTSYNLYRKQTGQSYFKVNAAPIPFDPSTETVVTYLDQPIVGDFEYSFYVTAVDVAGNESPHSAEVVAFIPEIDVTPPQAPTAFAADGGNGVVALHWNPVSLDVSGHPETVVGYSVYRSDQAGGPYAPVFAVDGATTQVNDDGVANGSTYFYIVTATDDWGNVSGYSVEDGARPASAFVPVPVLSQPDGSVILTTSSPGYVGQAQLGLQVRVFVLGVGQVADGVADHGSFTLHGAPLPDGTYTAYADAVDAHGNVSDFSAFRTFTIQAPPAVPVGLAAQGGDQMALLSWQPNGESDLMLYLVYRLNPQPVLVASVPAGTISHVVTGLTNGAPATFAISALDNTGNESHLSSAVTVTPTLPSGITGLQMSVLPSSPQFGESVTVAVKAVNASGSVVPFLGYGTLSTNDPLAQPTSQPLLFQSGQVVAHLSFGTMGTWALTATGAGLSRQANVTVKPRFSPPYGTPTTALHPVSTQGVTLPFSVEAMSAFASPIIGRDVRWEIVLLPGAWSSAAPLAGPRSGHVTITLPDNRIFIVGGRDLFGRPVPFAEIYDPATNSFSKAGDLWVPRIGAMACLIGEGSVVVAGGRDEKGILVPYSEVWNPADGTFELGGLTIAPRENATFSPLPDGRAFLAGGNDDTGPLSSTEIFWQPGFWYGFPTLGAFVPGPILAAPRTRHSAVVLDGGSTPGAILLVGGTSDGHSAVSLVERFTVSTHGDTLATVAPMLQSRVLPGVVSLRNGRVVVFGGSPVVPGTAGWPADLLTSGEVFDSASGAWSPTLPMPFGVVAPEAVAISADTFVACGGAFVSGGNQTNIPNTPPVRRTLLFDSRALTFSVAASMREPRVGHSLSLLPDGALLAVGGIADGQVPTESVERFSLSGVTSTGSRFADGSSSQIVPTDSGGISSPTASLLDVGALPGMTLLRATLLVTGSTSDFYVEGFEQDTGTPTLLAMEPVEGAPGVSVYPRIRLVFTEALDPFTVPPNDLGALFLTGPSGLEPVYAVNDYPNVFVLTPQTPLLPATQYSFGVSPFVTDLSGNLVNSGLTFSFRTTEPPGSIAALPGYDAAGAPLATLGNPFSTPAGNPMQVSLLGPGGLPVAGWPVIFRVAQGGGTFFPSGYRDVTIMTGQDGIAAAPPFTLGSTPGSQTVVEAFPANVNNPPVAQFALVTTTTSPRQFIVIPSTLSAAAGQSVSVTVRLVDSQGVTITDAQDPVILYASGATAPNGSASSPNTLTGLSLQNGELTVPDAFTFYDTGHRVIACTLAANAFVFGWITVEVGPSVPTAIVATGFGDGQSGAPGSTLMVPFSVFLTDTFANPVPAAPVRFTVIGGSASFAGSATADVTSNVQGVASSPLLTLGGTLGLVTVRAEATGSSAPPIDFTAFVLDVSTAPAVASVSPVDGALQAPVGSQVVIAFSAPMNLSALNGGNIYLQSLGAVQPTSISLSSDGSGNTIVTLTPTTPLDVEATCSVTVRSSVTNVAGNPMAGDFVSFFTTQGIAPTVISFAPVDGSGSIPLNSAVVATFSESMDTSSIGATSFILMGPLGPIEAFYSYSVDVDGHAVAALRPKHQLALGTIYTASLTSGATDLAGTPLQGPAGTTFTTSNSDASAPSVVSVVPAAGSSAVPLDIQIVVTFDEDLNPATITTTSVRLTDPAGSVVNVPAALSSNVLTLNAAQAVPPLASTTTYTLTLRGGVTGLADVVGNRMEADFVASFTTLDVEAPRVLSVSPPDTAQAFQPDQRAHVVFSEPMNGDTLTPATMYFQPAIQGTWSFTASGTEAFFAPTGNLWPLNRAYTLTIEGANDGPPTVRDLTGIAMQQTFTSSFRTGRILVTSPADGLITNHLTIDILGLCDGSTFAIEADGHPATMPGGTFVIAGYPLTEGLNVITLRAYFGAPNPEVTQIRVTRDTVAPRVVSMYPEPGETDVPITVVPVASFSEPVKRSTVIVSSGSPQSVMLSEVGGASIAVNRTLSEDGTLVAAQPTALLGMDRPYRFDVLATITDLAGNPLVQPGYSEFSTSISPNAGWTAEAGLPGTPPGDSQDEPPQEEDPAEEPNPLPVALAIIAGGHQRGLCGTCAEEDLTVAVTEGGEFAPGFRVSFTVVSGTGLVLASKQEGLSEVTNASGRAAVRFLFGHEPGATLVQASISGREEVEPVTFTLTAVSPTLTLLGTPLINGDERNPLLLNESPGYDDPHMVGFIPGRTPWVLQVLNPVTGEPLAKAEVLLRVGHGSGDSFVPDDDPDQTNTYLVPETCNTDEKGFASFSIVTKGAGGDTVRFELVDFPSVPPIERTFVRGDSRSIPGKLFVETAEFPYQFGSPPLRSLVISGNGQVGVKGVQLGHPIRLDVQQWWDTNSTWAADLEMVVQDIVITVRVHTCQPNGAAN